MGFLTFVNSWIFANPVWVALTISILISIGAFFWSEDMKEVSILYTIFITLWGLSYFLTNGINGQTISMMGYLVTSYVVIGYVVSFLKFILMSVESGKSLGLRYAERAESYKSHADYFKSKHPQIDGKLVVNEQFIPDVITRNSSTRSNIIDCLVHDFNLSMSYTIDYKSNSFDSDNTAEFFKAVDLAVVFDSLIGKSSGPKFKPFNVYRWKYSETDLFKELIASHKSVAFNQLFTNSEGHSTSSQFDLLLKLITYRVFVLKDLTIDEFFESMYVPRMSVYKHVMNATRIAWPTALIWMLTHKIGVMLNEILQKWIKKPFNMFGEWIFNMTK